MLHFIDGYCSGSKFLPDKLRGCTAGNTRPDDVMRGIAVCDGAFRGLLVQAKIGVWVESEID